MTIRRTSLILPCRRLEDFPTHLRGQPASELLAAWTALWHPSLIRLTQGLPGWHPAEDPPDPSTLEGELVLVPSISRQQLAGDWCERLRATAPLNPPPVEAVAAREQTLAAALDAAAIPRDQVTPAVADDFLALGYAHLQVELLTRAMHYMPVLDDEQFSGAVVAAAQAAVAGNDQVARDELGRAFDFLADARNHVYAVDFYVIDVTLLAPTVLGEELRSKLAAGSPTDLLLTGELIEQLASEQPQTLNELRRALEANTVGLVGGLFHGGATGWESPEWLLAEIQNGQHAIEQHVGRRCEVFGQFNSSFSSMLPEILAGTNFKAALHAAFDGGRLPRAEQCKTRWGQSDGPRIEALSASPLDVGQPETWLTFAERVGDSIAHDHVATVLLAGWPGGDTEYYGDLRRAGRYNAVLGKLVTLEEYFRITRETDDWTTFLPREYPSRIAIKPPANPISSRVDSYRRDVQQVYRELSAGVLSIASSFMAMEPAAAEDGKFSAVLNPWNFAGAQLVGLDPLDFSRDTGRFKRPMVLPDVPGFGYAVGPAPATAPAVPLVDGTILRNESLELTVSTTTGGIQSLRTHRDRSTRVSQRLVFHRQHSGRAASPPAQDGSTPALETKMVADRVVTTHNDPAIGQITTDGRLLDAADQLLARFTQTIRLARGLPAALLDVQLDPVRLPEGDVWSSYFASRLAWSDEAASWRCGVQWSARETTHERIESPEWVEVSDGDENVVCLALGLPYHRRVGPTWLDSLLVTAGEEGRRFQFAIGLDCLYPTQTALGLLTSGMPTLAKLADPPAEPRGWFLHLSAKNVIITHLSRLEGERAGIRCRILETEGRSAVATLSACRPFSAARTTDFRGQVNDVLSVVEGRVPLDVGPHRWVQLEAEW